MSFEAYIPQTWAGQFMTQANQTYHTSGTGTFHNTKVNLSARIDYLEATCAALIDAIVKIVQGSLGTVGDIMTAGRWESLREANRRTFTMAGADLAALPDAVKGIFAPSTVSTHYKTAQNNRILELQNHFSEIAGADQWPNIEQKGDDFYEKERRITKVIHHLEEVNALLNLGKEETQSPLEVMQEPMACFFSLCVDYLNELNTQKKPKKSLSWG